MCALKASFVIQKFTNLQNYINSEDVWKDANALFIICINNIKLTINARIYCHPEMWFMWKAFFPTIIYLLFNELF